jgi:hypothetical protein
MAWGQQRSGKCPLVEIRKRFAAPIARWCTTHLISTEGRPPPVFWVASRVLLELFEWPLAPIASVPILWIMSIGMS